MLDAALASSPWIRTPRPSSSGRTAREFPRLPEPLATEGVRGIVGHPFPADLAAAVLGARGIRWIPALAADGTAERDVGEVAEFTARGDLSGWPPGSRRIVRREIPHPGAPRRFPDVHGYRYPVCLTHQDTPDLACLAALDRSRGRCAPAIRDLQATGLTHLPSARFARNAAGLTAVLLAGDLLAGTRGVLLTGALRRATAPRLRYTLLHTAGRLVRFARRTTVRRPRTGPWAEALRGAFARCARLTAASP